MIQKNYKIGEVARRLDTSIRTIRYYEEEKLLIPSRTERGTRLYNKKHLTRLKVILRLTQLGFSIKAIRNLAALRESSQTGDSSHVVIKQCLKESLTYINQQVEILDSLKKEIQYSLYIVQKCKGCENQPTTKGCPKCPVKRNLGNIELLNLIWDTK